MHNYYYYVHVILGRLCPLQYEKFNHIGQFRPTRSSSQMAIPYPTIKIDQGRKVLCKSPYVRLSVMGLVII